ncbi:hypothetical protein [Sphingobacterium sp. LRF_L2]|uniref:hypothetical protein n=1 Tax=Sphingobacterium sp. LRF_L2 TaxID=3369421 RepID=UPI003F5F5210
MQKIHILTLFIIGSLLFSSCLDFVEQIDMHNDGSGSIKATLNLSKSRTKVASLMKLKNVNGIKIPTEASIKQEMQNAVNTLKNTAGISNVKYNLDFDNYIATLSCDFKTINALNTFSSTLSKQFKIQITSYNNYSFNPNTQTFVRNYTHTTNLAKEFSKIAKEDQKLFEDAYYTNIIRFQKGVKSQTNNAAKLSSNSQAVLLKIKATDLIQGSSSLANTITLSK